MGEVYRARDTRRDREVAVKVLPEHLANDPQALARFEREGKVVAAHPGHRPSRHQAGQHFPDRREQGHLVMRFSHTPALTGDLEHWQYDTSKPAGGIAAWRRCRR
jgi:serine/threonine protein kinase